MITKPEISISADEPKKDKLGQFWSPGKVTLKWPDTGELPAPLIQISLVAPVRGDMTVDELRAADGRQAEAPHPQQALGRPVERAGERHVRAGIERTPGVGNRQRGIDVTGGGTDDDQEPTPRGIGRGLRTRYVRLLVAFRRYASNDGGSR